MLLKDRFPEELGEWGSISPKGFGTGWGIFDVGRLGIIGACGVSPENDEGGCAGCTGFGGATGDGADGAKIVLGRGAGENLKIYI